VCWAGTRGAPLQQQQRLLGLQVHLPAPPPCRPTDASCYPCPCPCHSTAAVPETHPPSLELSLPAPILATLHSLEVSKRAQPAHSGKALLAAAPVHPLICNFLPSKQVAGCCRPDPLGQYPPDASRDCGPPFMGHMDPRSCSSAWCPQARALALFLHNRLQCVCLCSMAHGWPQPWAQGHAMERRRGMCVCAGSTVCRAACGGIEAGGGRECALRCACLCEAAALGSRAVHETKAMLQASSPSVWMSPGPSAGALIRPISSLVCRTTGPFVGAQSATAWPGPQSTVLWLLPIVTFRGHGVVLVSLHDRPVCARIPGDASVLTHSGAPC
jgi:hypothetical protein